MSVVYVCPLSALDDTLASCGTRHMISLSSPGKSPNRPAQINGHYLPLEFNDISEPREGLIAPSRANIESLFNFYSIWGARDPLLIHCWMGISRSTAAAVLAAAFFNPHQDMTELAGNLRKASPMATPNALMISHGDDLLGLDGKLSGAIQSIGRGEDAFEGVPFSMSVNP